MRRLVILMLAAMLIAPMTSSAQAQDGQPSPGAVCRKLARQGSSQPFLSVRPQPNGARQVPSRLLVVGCNFKPGERIEVTTYFIFADQKEDGAQRNARADGHGSFRMIVGIAKHGYCRGPEYGTLVYNPHITVTAQATSQGQDPETGEYRGPSATVTIEGIPVAGRSDPSKCARDRVPSTFRVKVLGHAPPGQAFVAVHDQLNDT